MVVDWSKLTELYDQQDALRRSRAHKSSNRTGEVKVKEWSSKWIEYATNQIYGSYLEDTFQGTTNLNINASDEHIANVILTQYKHIIHPFRTPFRTSDFVPEAVWQVMLKKVAECKTIHREWIATEKIELWRRDWQTLSNEDYQDILTSIEKETSYVVIEKPPIKCSKKVTLRVELGLLQNEFSSYEKKF